VVEKIVTVHGSGFKGSEIVYSPHKSEFCTMLWENSIRRQTRIFRFLQYAKGSCTEADGKLYVALDQKYITNAEFHNPEPRLPSLPAISLAGQPAVRQTGVGQG